MADINGKNNPFYGKTHTAKTKEILRKQKLGKKLPEEQKKKISENHSRHNMKTYNILNSDQNILKINITSEEAINIIGCGQSYFYEVARGKKRRALGWRVEFFSNSKTPFSDSEKPKTVRDMSGLNNPMYGKPGTFKGKHHSEESRKKLSESRMGRFKGLDNPKTKLFTIDNDVLDIHLENILVEEALKVTEMKKSTLYQAARTRIPSKDWKIGYIEDKEKPFNQKEKNKNKIDPEKLSYRKKLKLGIISENTTPIEGRIYVHRNKINGKHYVGQTIQEDIENRWREGKGYKGNQVFKKAIEKYGWENFEHIIVPEIFRTQKELNEAEVRYIEKYDSIKNGYNILPGGFSNPMANPESREKMRKAITGLKRTPEQIERNRQAKLNKWNNMDPIEKEKVRKKLSEAAKKRTGFGEKNPFYGKTHSEETRKTLSAKMTGKNKGADSYKSRKVICNETKEVYVSIRDAFEKTGIPASSISNDCRNLYNKRKKERITFSYLED